MELTALSEKFLQIGKLGKLPSFVFGSICWTFILLPVKISEILGITDIINSNRALIGFFSIFFTIYLLSFLTYEYLREHLSQWIIINRVKKRLRNLTKDEKEALRPFIEENKRTQQFSLSDGIAGGLEAKEILYRSSTLGSFRDEFPYNIQDHAFEYLSTHKYLVGEE
jgi:hypothetical protein